MADQLQPQGGTPGSRELAVPVLMLGGIGLYAYDSIHLSVPALILPAALMAVILAALLWLLAASFIGVRGAKAAEPAADGEDDSGGPILNWKPWLLVAIPALVFVLLDYVGALAALVAMVFGAQLVFGARSPVKSLIIAVVVTVPTYALFKYFLYVRFPPGVLGLG